MPKEDREDDVKALEVTVANLQKEAEFWKNEALRIDKNWLSTWRTFQVQYNELQAKLDILKEIMTKKQDKPQGLVYE